jgi:hypothetical protein
MIEVVEANGHMRQVELQAFRAELNGARATVCGAFAQQRLDVIGQVSKQILARGASRTSPGVTHFAFWTRPSALKRLVQDATGRFPADCVARPRGLVFHLPPQNVETVFLYSWVISYLAGNANLTRLPAELSGDMSELLSLTQAAVGPASDSGQYFVRYPVTDQTNRAISQASDVRVVWGGDAKVAAFADIPLRHGGKPIWFGDRTSLAIANGEAVARLDGGGLDALAERLFADIFVFDQMACSSPQRLYVVGDEASHGPTVRALLERLSGVAERRGWSAGAGNAIRKSVRALARAGAGGVRAVTRHSHTLTSVVLDEPVEAQPVGGGFLWVDYAPALAAIYPALRENTQTVVHFGFAAEDIKAFAAGLPPFCVKRLAPIGEALDFDVVWDGYDLAAEFVQLLRVR